MLSNLNWTIVLQVFTLCLLYSETKKLYNSLRVSNFSSQYQYHFKVADLISNLLIIGHIMALILYCSTKAGYETNWLSNINLDTQQALVFYLYAFYFSTTTIFTVGYGDITPTNPIEVLTVILVQVCGIVMLAYIINEIGFCLSSLRKNQQLLEKDLQVLQKMKKQYFLRQDLMQRANQYLVNSYEKAYQLTPEQQQGIIKKLNQELRDQIQKSSLISIVKSSIFLVCRWTYRMQKAVSLKLIHALFSPNDTIYQPQGKQRLYFIRSGTIGVYADLKIRKATKKLLKIITNTLNKQISNNCYGYTAIISSRSTILEAIAKQFTSAYYITKQNFFNCVCQNFSDFEYFHQLKTKIELSRVAEALQVPFLVNSKQHYNPNRLKIIYNYVNRQGRNRRNIFKRRAEKIKNKKMVNPDDKSYANQFNSEETITKDFSKEKFSIVFNTFVGNDHVGEVKSDQLFNYHEKNQKIERQAKKSKTYIKALSNDKKNPHFQLHLVHYFESGREYSNYFAKQNRNNILTRLEKQLFVVSSRKDSKKQQAKECFELIKNRKQL